MRRASALLLAVTAGSWPAVAANDDESVLLQAMRDELARSMAALQLQNLERPYFLAYRVEETTAVHASASFGALEHRSGSASRRRALTLEVRVGSPSLDNTNYLPERPWSSPLTRSYRLPLTDDYRELRRSLWLATDTAYKHALETLARKRGALQNQTREALADFSPAEPYADFAAADPQPLPGDAVVELVRAGSAVFRKFPEITASHVHGSAANGLTTYVNSEGTEFVQPRYGAALQVAAATQAADGTVLQDYHQWHVRRWRELPPQAQVLAWIRRQAELLTERRTAPALARYNGPVLFEGQAAAELVAQALVPRLLGDRAPVVESSRMGSYAASLGNPFVDRIGGRVLSRFLHVVDDPTATANAGGPLLGGYAVDAQGVAAAPTTLIQSGVLKTLLTSRNPVAGIAGSSGNLRGHQLLPSNLLLTASDGLAPEALRQELLALAAERGNDYGVVVRRLGGAGMQLMRDTRTSSAAGGQMAIGLVSDAVKVYPDGREERIPKAEIAAFGIGSFRDVVAASAAVTNHTRQLTPPNAYTLRSTTGLYGGYGSGQPVTISTPALLFDELTLRKPIGNAPRPPIAAHPFFVKAEAEGAGQ